MDVTRILNFGCALLLMVCLIFSVVSITKMQTAVAENAAMQEEARALLQTLDGELSKLKQENDSASIPTATPNETTPTQSYRIQSVGEKIGVYTADGTLVRLIDINPATLPRADREALENGISVDSWERALSYLADYTA